MEIERKKNEGSDLLKTLEKKEEKGAVFIGKWDQIIGDKFLKGRMQLLYTIVFRVSITSRIIIFGHKTESYLIFTDTF